MARWTGVVDASIGALQDIPEEAFNRPGKLSDEILAEACMRVINHQNAHLRQIWFILGHKGTEGRWPKQETWLA